MNMKEIAQLAGVTAATVSNAINGTGNVSEKKRKEIMEIIEKGGVQSQSFCQKSQDKGEQYDWNHGRRYYSFSDTTNY